MDHRVATFVIILWMIPGLPGRRLCKYFVAQINAINIRYNVDTFNDIRNDNNVTLRATGCRVDKSPGSYHDVKVDHFCRISSFSDLHSCNPIQ